MTKTAVLFLLLSGLWVHAAESGVTNLVITPLEVDPKSVSLTGAETRQPNLNFNYLNKTPEWLAAISKRQPPVVIVKDGVVVAKTDMCVKYAGRHSPDGRPVITGLTLAFDDLDQARRAEKVLKREDKKPE